MTLIALLVKDGDQSIALSDLAISNLNKEQQEADILPFRRVIRLNQRGATNSIIGVEHKIVIFGNHLVMWSGDLESAKLLCHFLYNDGIVHTLHAENFLELSRRILGPRMQQLSLIYCENLKEEIRFSHHRCHEANIGGTKVVCAGSGVAALHEEMRSLATADEVFTESTFRVAMSLVSGLLRREIFDPDFYDDSFGYSYDFALSDDKGFFKPNYNTLFFSGNHNGFGLTQFVDVRGLINSTIIRNFTSKDGPVVLDNWPYLMNPHLTFESAMMCADFLRPRLDAAHLWDLLEQAARSQEVSAEGMFTLVFLMKVNDAGMIVGCEQAFFMPAVINYGNGGFYRAWFRRIIESYYVGRRYEPPSEKAEFYAAFFGKDFAGSELLI